MKVTGRPAGSVYPLLERLERLGGGVLRTGMRTLIALERAVGCICSRTGQKHLPARP